MSGTLLLSEPYCVDELHTDGCFKDVISVFDDFQLAGYRKHDV